MLWKGPETYDTVAKKEERELLSKFREKIKFADVRLETIQVVRLVEGIGRQRTVQEVS